MPGGTTGLSIVSFHKVSRANFTADRQSESNTSPIPDADHGVAPKPTARQSTPSLIGYGQGPQSGRKQGAAICPAIDSAAGCHWDAASDAACSLPSTDTPQESACARIGANRQLSGPSWVNPRSADHDGDHRSQTSLTAICKGHRPLGQPSTLGQPSLFQSPAINSEAAARQT